jgi:uncharacterized membrane protein
MSGQNLLRTALLGSVGLNLFLLGVLVPGWLGHNRLPAGMHAGPGAMGPGPARDMMLLRQAIDDLPPADAEILRNLLDKGQRQFSKVGDDVRDQFETMLELIKADPLDSKALLAEFDKLSATRDAFDRARVGEVVEALSKMSVEGRRKLAESRFSRRIVDGGPLGPEGGPPDEMGPRPGGIPFNRDRMVNPPPPSGDAEGQPEADGPQKP